jgi:hypothetical protein
VRDKEVQQSEFCYRQEPKMQVEQRDHLSTERQPYYCAPLQITQRQKRCLRVVLEFCE